MGCDIHAFLEVKLADGKWYYFGQVDLGRDYALFGRMAGVRDREPPLFGEPKGWPSDASVVSNTHYKRWEGDAHTESWLSADEMRQLSDWYVSHREWPTERKDADISVFDYDRTHVRLYGNEISSWWKYPSSRGSSASDIRLVFFFDN